MGGLLAITIDCVLLRYIGDKSRSWHPHTLGSLFHDTRHACCSVITRPSILRGDIKRCTPSVCPSVCPAPAIYCTHNIVYTFMKRGSIYIKLTTDWSSSHSTHFVTGRNTWCLWTVQKQSSTFQFRLNTASTLCILLHDCQEIEVVVETSEPQTFDRGLVHSTSAANRTWLVYVLPSCSQKYCNFSRKWHFPRLCN